MSREPLETMPDVMDAKQLPQLVLLFAALLPLRCPIAVFSDIAPHPGQGALSYFRYHPDS